MLRRDYAYSIPWNLLLITTGSLIYAVALKGIALDHGFIPAGLFGVAVLVQQLSDAMGAGLWYLLLNIPMFLVGWIFISRRFLLYSLYAMVVTGLSYTLLPVHLEIHDQLYAAVSCGALSGAGAGMVLRSLGSNGGIDVVGVILFQRFNLGLGKFYFLFNALLYAVCFLTRDADLVIASLIMSFVASQGLDYVLALFSQRKLTLIISEHSEVIAEEILDKLKIGATFLEGQGAYRKGYKRVLMAVINNIQLKRLEEIVFTHDPHALFVVENTFSVIGSTFSKRKLY